MSTPPPQEAPHHSTPKNPYKRPLTLTLRPRAPAPKLEYSRYGSDVYSVRAKEVAQQRKTQQQQQQRAQRRQRRYEEMEYQEYRAGMARAGGGNARTGAGTRRSSSTRSGGKGRRGQRQRIADARAANRISEQQPMRQQPMRNSRQGRPILIDEYDEEDEEDEEEEEEEEELEDDEEDDEMGLMDELEDSLTEDDDLESQEEEDTHGVSIPQHHENNDLMQMNDLNDVQPAAEFQAEADATEPTATVDAVAEEEEEEVIRRPSRSRKRRKTNLGLEARADDFEEFDEGVAQGRFAGRLLRANRAVDYSKFYMPGKGAQHVNVPPINNEYAGIPTRREFDRAQFYTRRRRNDDDHFGIFHSPRKQSKHGYFGKRRRARSSSSSSSDRDPDASARRDADRMAKLKSALPINMPAHDIESFLRSRPPDSLLTDADPLNIDKTVDFKSVGGLDHHISALKEMVMLPLVYPEVFSNFSIQPPRGVLFYGPPGTGKTLLARALANACSVGTQKVSFFVRKGADVLTKWVGESERQLRVLFEQAKKMQPSIIFFDEIDGLAPVRSSKQEQVHASLVTTLLALMDGLDSRGQVVVIGATNRIDAIDPALRRPGRFDREFYFPLPSEAGRRSIFEIALSKWKEKPNDDLMGQLARLTKGYCGGDIQALVVEAAIRGVKRKFPQIYDATSKLQIDPTTIRVDARDFMSAVRTLIPAAGRTLPSIAAPLPENLCLLLGQTLEAIRQHLRPVLRGTAEGEQDRMSAMDEHDILVSRGYRKGTTDGADFMSQNSIYRFIVLGKENAGQCHIGPAILDILEGFYVQSFDLDTLLRVPDKNLDSAIVHLFTEVLRQKQSVIYVPNIDVWWTNMSELAQDVFLHHVTGSARSKTILLLATAHHSANIENLPEALQLLFFGTAKSITMETPSAVCRFQYFQRTLEQLCIPLITKAEFREARKITELQPLAQAETIKARELTQEECDMIQAHDEYVIRELTIELRTILIHLMKERKWMIFVKPVDPAEYQDYFDMIQNPSDLTLVAERLEQHQFIDVASFLEEIDLIVDNAVQYNSDSDHKLITLARDMQDHAHAMCSRLNPELIRQSKETASRIREGRCGYRSKSAYPEGKTKAELSAYKAGKGGRYKSVGSIHIPTSPIKIRTRTQEPGNNVLVPDEIPEVQLDEAAIDQAEDIAEPDNTHIEVESDEVVESTVISGEAVIERDWVGEITREEKSADPEQMQPQSEPHEIIDIENLINGSPRACVSTIQAPPIVEAELPPSPATQRDIQNLANMLVSTTDDSSIFDLEELNSFLWRMIQAWRTESGYLDGERLEGSQLAERLTKILDHMQKEQAVQRTQRWKQNHD